jgi:TonB-linked SusC/RagA family outer membrane protein
MNRSNKQIIYSLFFLFILIDLQAQKDSVSLTELVVVGYNTVSKGSFTGAATQLKTDYGKQSPVQSFEQALSGKAAGANISLPNGVLNNAPVIRIRGVNSISLSSYPLIIVNGIPIFTGDISTGAYVGNNPLADINPADIESIDILKDAASTAIYGSRAAAGVIVITTKKGDARKTAVSYNYSIAATNAVRLPKVLNASQYMEVKNEAVRNAKILSGKENDASVASALFFPSYNADGSEVNTNWNDYVYRTGISQNHHLSIDGGDETTNYYLSANYTNQQGFLIDNNFTRKGIYFNIKHNINRNLQLNANLSYNNSFNQAQNTGSLRNSAFLLIGAARMAMVLPPNVSAYNADGTYNISSTGRVGNGNNLITNGYYNPVALFANSRYTSGNDHIIGNLSATYRILRNLSFTTNYSLDRINTENISFNSARLGSTGFNVKGDITNSYALRNSWIWSNTLKYNTSFFRNNIQLLAGYEQQKMTFSGWGVNATGAIDPFFENYQGGWSIYTPANNFLSEKALVSYFGRMNYDFDNKILLAINLRRDGNSALAEGNKFGNFGGISAGWVMTEESFFKNTGLRDFVDFFKLRAGYGIVGNANLPTDYGSMNLYAATVYGTEAGLSISQAGNKQLGWETSKQANIGFDATILKNKMQISFSFFNNNIDGLILNAPQSPSKGIPGNVILANVGSMYNRGIEVELNYKVLNTGHFTWETSLNYTHVRNKVTALADGNADIVSYTHISSETTNITRVGYSVGSLYAAKTAGVNPENGRRIFVNAKGQQVQYSEAVASGQSNWTFLDGTTAPAINTADYQIVGNAIPVWYGGFNNNLRYKKFDLKIDFTYSGGNSVMYGTRGSLLDMRYLNNTVEVLSRWTSAGQTTNIPRVVYGDQTSNGAKFPISENVQKADFLRLNNLMLAYHLSDKICNKIKMSEISVYVQGSNIWLLTAYKGSDPEASSNGNSNLTPGVDKNSVGLGRTITFGVNIKI